MSEPIKVWRKDGFSLKLWETGRRHPNGQELLRYEFRDGKRLIFSGSDFGASPLHAIDSLQTVYALLDFLSAGEGATDADYFSGYTPEQITWRDSDRRERLSVLVSEFDVRQERSRR